MKLSHLITIFFCFAASLQLSAQPDGRVNFDANWKFHLGDITGAEKASFPDQKWRELNLPHDWSIEGIFRPDNPSGHQGGLLPGGIGWYRKKFSLTDIGGKKYFIVFDGVYKNSTVYINGNELGTRPYGYATFQYDMTPYIHEGENILAVKVDNSKQPDSRWYTGAGIYRHVWLITSSPVSVDQWGTFVTTPNVSTQEATVNVVTTIANDTNEKANLKISSSIVDDSGKEVAIQNQSAKAVTNGKVVLNTSLKVISPKLWDVENPNLYRLVTKVYQGKDLKDTYTTTFGIRSIAFKSDSGFYLNGKNVKILGVCNHHDLGSLGSALNDRALQRQLELLKTMGCNAIRCSHNLMAPELLEMCDQMGFLVMDETFDSWYIGKDAAPFGFQNYFKDWHEREITDMVLRDRNHPSVIFWSIGNEIKEQWFPGSTNGGDIARELVATIKKYDTTRFTTSAFNFIRDAEKKGMTAAVDVVGFNYTIDAYDEIRQKHPDWFYLASETTSQFDSRGVYHFTLDTIVKTFPDCQTSAFDDAGGGTTHEEAWLAVKNRAWMSGLYIWTGFDYMGEPAPYEKLAVSSYFGIFDLCGFPKDSYYFYKSQWTKEPMVHLLPHWNWNDGQMIDVVAYTNCDEVKLYLNNQPFSTKKISETKKLSLRWKVPFEAGTLKAEAYRNGKLVATEIVKTAGDAAKIDLSADRNTIHADGKDLSFITVKITDENGTLVPNADNLVHFELEGEGEIVGVGNGNAMSLEPAKGKERRAFSGMCQVIIQSAGKAGDIRLRASSLGLPEAIISLKSN
ncbi:MAG: glycoside hydrolase family 2 protein [Prolixibacteraceae bacterium]|nr:glycoside hydrolase family 2 protein [Prolixibacteraceae bacterium]